MRVVKIIFSPTGGTKRVADMLAEALPGPKAEIDLTDSRFDSCERIGPEDLALIAMPVYPETADKRVQIRNIRSVCPVRSGL